MKFPRIRVTIRALLLLTLAVALAIYCLMPGPLAGMHFALIGPIDRDRDGRDDRDDLRRLIVRNGGVIDFDLPPSGPASGRISPMTTYYVTDDRSPGQGAGPVQQARRAAAIAEARADGVRPLPVEKLVARIKAGKASPGRPIAAR